MLAYSCLRVPPRLLVLLRWPYRPLLRLRSSLRLRVGLRLPQSSAFPSYAGWSSAGLQSHLWNLVLFIIRVPADPFVDRWASAGPTHGCRAAAGPCALPQASAGPHATPLALLLLRLHLLALGFLLQLRSLVRCRSLLGTQPVALRSLNVRWSDLPPFLIVFPPGFCLSTPGCMFGGCGFT